MSNGYTPYTGKQVAWMLKHCKEFDDWRTFTEVFNRVFSDTRSSLKSFGHTHGVVLAKNFTSEQKEWLIEHAQSGKYSIKMLTYLFNHTFHAHKTESAIGMLCHVYLKVGTKEHYINHHTTAVGSELRTVDGYTLVKVSDTGTRDDKYKLKHRVVWEQAYGPIPEGYVIAFIDGDKSNTDLSNLRCISNRVAGTANAYKGTNADIFDAGVALGQLKEALYNAAQEVL